MATQADNAEAEWSVLIYMAADNSLEKFANDTLAELEGAFGEVMNASGSKGVRVFVMKDLQAGATVHSLPPEEGKPGPRDLGKRNMGDPETLKTFINETGAYPSKRIALIIWNHGGGTLGLDRSAAGDFLTNTEFSQALSNVNPEISKRIELIACDACMTSTIELANDIRRQAVYYVAPETNTPSKGWPYRAIVEQLRRTPGMDAEQLAESILNQFARSAPPDNTAVLGAWRLPAIERLTKAIDKLGEAFCAYFSEKQSERANELAAVRDRAIVMEDPDYVDLESLLAPLEEIPPLRAVAGACREALRAARLDVRPERGLSGMSILFPAPGESSHWVKTRLAAAYGTKDTSGNAFRPLVAGLKGARNWERFLKSRLPAAVQRALGDEPASTPAS